MMILSVASFIPILTLVNMDIQLIQQLHHKIHFGMYSKDRDSSITHLQGLICYNFELILRDPSR